MEIRGLFENKRFLKAIILVGAFVVIFLVSNIFIVGGDEVFNISNTLISPAAALLTSFLFYQASTNKNDTVSR